MPEDVMPASTAPVVEPNAPTAPAAPTAAEAPAEEGGDIPDELLKIPAVQAVVVGSPPAISTRLDKANDKPEFKVIAENRDALLGAGIGFYQSLSKEWGVMFNSMKISPEDIKAADQQGQLRTIAPDFDLVNHEVAKLGPYHPARNTGAAPALPASATPPQSASGQLPLMPPPPASVQRRLAQQRVMNLNPGAPTSGPAPGAGRLLNQVLKPVT